jgi:N-terminal domain of galactosyltransferase
LQLRYIGGILLVPNEIFEKIGGMNNHFWGWDQEDHEFLHQLERHNVSIRRQSKHIGTGYEDTVLHLHDINARPRDSARCHNQTKRPRSLRGSKEGLNSTEYNLLEVQELTVDGYEVTFLNVQLICNQNETPWCDCGRRNNSDFF